MGDEVPPAGGLPVPDDIAFTATILGGAPDLSANDLEDRLGMPVEQVLRLWRVMGFPVPEADEAVFVEDDLVLFHAVMAGKALLGEEAIEQFVRVLSSAQAKVADAAMSVARTQLTGPMLVGGASQDELVEVGRVAGEALSDVALVLAPLFRHHTLVARRRSLVRHVGLPVEAFARARQLVGFGDLVASTTLHATTEPSVLAHAIAEFEATSADEVARADGRVIKHIGDEVMFTTNDAAAGCRAALAITTAVAAHPVLTQMRAALSFGEVVPQGGDVYGETVNVAARATHVAEPGQVLVTAAARDEAAEADDLVFRSVGSHHLRDVGEVELFSVAAPDLT